MSALPTGVLKAAQQAGGEFSMRDFDPGERAETISSVAEIHHCQGHEELIGEIADWYGARLRKYRLEGFAGQPWRAA